MRNWQALKIWSETGRKIRKVGDPCFYPATAFNESIFDPLIEFECEPLEPQKVTVTLEQAENAFNVWLEGTHRRGFFPGVKKNFLAALGFKETL